MKNFQIILKVGSDEIRVDYDKVKEDDVILPDDVFKRLLELKSYLIKEIALLNVTTNY